LQHPSFDQKLPSSYKNAVEVDETYIGGKHKPTSEKWKNKTAVVALVERGGNVRSRVMDRVTGENLRKFVTDNVAPFSYVNTDDHMGYRGLDRKYEHGVVKHSAKEYARGDVHTNTVEGFFSLLKRGVIGTFHQVSKKHLPLYLAEFDHRYNHRKATDGERTVSALRMAEGKRLTLKPLKRGGQL
jgi:transposase-like protein